MIIATYIINTPVFAHLERQFPHFGRYIIVFISFWWFSVQLWNVCWRYIFHETQQVCNRILIQTLVYLQGESDCFLRFTAMLPKSFFIYCPVISVGTWLPTSIIFCELSDYSPLKEIPNRYLSIACALALEQSSTLLKCTSFFPVLAVKQKSTLMKRNSSLNLFLFCIPENRNLLCIFPWMKSVGLGESRTLKTHILSEGSTFDFFQRSLPVKTNIFVFFSREISMVVILELRFFTSR